jgi:hypothetical protein
MTMKKLACWTLVVLFANLLMSCAAAAPKLVEPGGKIGDMTVENHVITGAAPSIWTYCNSEAYMMREPGTATVDCEIPRTVSRLALGIGWVAKDEATLETNLETIKWELYVDDHQINVDAFESTPKNWPEGPGIEWIIDLVNLTPGKHTLRQLWKADVPVDDGFDVYPPGTYEEVVNFTVPEE